MNRSFSKIRHIQESNMRLEKQMLSEQPLKQQTLSPQALSSYKAQDTKEKAEFFNKYYKLNLPLDGNWTNVDFNNTVGRYLKEKNIPIWVCKKGDGYCHDDDAGQIGTKEYGRFKSAMEQDSGKSQTSKINTTNDKTYDYKLENGKYYYSLKGQNKWVEATGKGLESIKTKVKF